MVSLRRRLPALRRTKPARQGKVRKSRKTNRPTSTRKTKRH